MHVRNRVAQHRALWMITLASVCAFAACTTLDKTYGEEQARQYAEDLGMKDAKVTCVNRDSDGDGYVSCTISTVDKDGKPSLQPVECGAYREGCFQKDGCRVPKRTEASP